MTDISQRNHKLEEWLCRLESYDPLTADHSHRVADLSVKLARKLGVEESSLEDVRQGALLHDIGKMAIPLLLLQKANRLTNDEWEIMKSHPEEAFRMLRRANFSPTIYCIPYGHHERWDGNGYPRGIKGPDIPLTVRIVSVADGYDTGTSDRPYQRAESEEAVLKVIHRMSGTHFDPVVVTAFTELLQKTSTI